MGSVFIFLTPLEFSKILSRPYGKWPDRTASISGRKRVKGEGVFEHVGPIDPMR